MDKQISVQVDHLSVNYDKRPVLWDINFSIPSGSLVGIVGPNGAGKTTLIKALLGLVPPISGQVLIHNKPLKDVRQQIAYVPQRESVDWNFPITVLDLVTMGCYGRLGLFRRPSKADKAAAIHHLKQVGIENLYNRQIGELSGGQQQRVFLARALLQDANIYFLDEPFAAIDHATEKMVITILRNLRDAGKTIFVVHHDLNTVLEYFDITMLINLRLIACGPTREVYNSEHLNAAYGKSYSLFDEALKLSHQERTGNLL